MDGKRNRRRYTERGLDLNAILVPEASSGSQRRNNRSPIPGHDDFRRVLRSQSRSRISVKTPRYREVSLSPEPRRARRSQSKGRASVKAPRYRDISSSPERRHARRSQSRGRGIQAHRYRQISSSPEPRCARRSRSRGRAMAPATSSTSRFNKKCSNDGSASQRMLRSQSRNRTTVRASRDISSSSEPDNLVPRRAPRAQSRSRAMVATASTSQFNRALNDSSLSQPVLSSKSRSRTAVRVSAPRDISSSPERDAFPTRRGLRSQSKGRELGIELDHCSRSAVSYSSGKQRKTQKKTSVVRKSSPDRGAPKSSGRHIKNPAREVTRNNSPPQRIRQIPIPMPEQSTSGLGRILRSVSRSRSNQKSISQTSNSTGGASYQSAVADVGRFQPASSNSLTASKKPSGPGNQKRPAPLPGPQRNFENKRRMIANPIRSGNHAQQTNLSSQYLDKTVARRIRPGAVISGSALYTSTQQPALMSSGLVGSRSTEAGNNGNATIVLTDSEENESSTEDDSRPAASQSDETELNSQQHNRSGTSHDDTDPLLLVNMNSQNSNVTGRREQGIFSDSDESRQDTSTEVSSLEVTNVEEKEGSRFAFKCSIV